MNVSMIANLPAEGKVYMLHFKRTFECSSKVQDANLSIAVSGVYQLFINNQRVGTGPCRTYPEFTQLDSYNIAPFLKIGENEILVKMRHLVDADFHHISTPPFFYATGAVEEISLATPANWLGAYDPAELSVTPNFSFAIGPVQIRDERLNILNWQELEAIDNVKTPEVLRSLPQLTELIREPVEVTKFSIDSTMTTYSLNLCSPTPKQSLDSRVCTYIYSPQELSVCCECWWGNFSLNGCELKIQKHGYRQYITMNLQLGWNYFEAKGGYCKGLWEFGISLPNNVGLIVNAEKKTINSGTFSVQKESDQAFELLDLAENSHAPLLSLFFAQEQKLISTVEANRPCLIKVDMGQITLGLIQIELDAPADTVVQIGYSEELLDGRVHYRKCPLVYAAEEWTLAKDTRILESFNSRGFRYLEILIKGHVETVDVRNIKVLERVYPYEFVGEFSCSEPSFNTLWSYGKRTLELCSEDVITDCPWRERTLYGGDLLVSMATTLVLTTDLRVLRHSLEVFRQSFNSHRGWLQSMAPIERNRVPLYEYPMLTVIALEWYWQMSNDRDFIELWRPVLEQMLCHFESLKQENGLYYPAQKSFITHKYSFADKSSLAFNSCGIKFLAAINNLLNLSNDNVIELEYAIHNNFFYKKYSRYSDLAEEFQIASADGNSWLGYFSSSDFIDSESIVELLHQKMEEFNFTNEESSISSYTIFYLLGALYKFGAVEEAENAINRVFKLMLDNPTGTLWEYANDSSSLCHAWSSASNYYLSTCTLGVKVCRDNTIIIAPQAHNISWAKGIVPHRLGEIKVHWELKDDILKIRYSVPENCIVKIMPKGRLSKYKILQEHF